MLLAALLRSSVHHGRALGRRAALFARMRKYEESGVGLELAMQRLDGVSYGVTVSEARVKVTSRGR